VLRRVMLAVSASDRIRDVMTTAPVTRDVVTRFVAGATQDDALRVTGELLGQGLLVTLDHLGEHTTDPEQAAAAADEYIALLGRLAGDGHARAGRAEVSVKPTAVGLGLKEHGEKTARENITRICTAAAAAGTTVTMDMEDHDLVEPTVRLLYELRQEFPDLGCVIQSYLRRSEADCAALARLTGARVRLCKGAYDAPEQVAFGGKREVDRSYVRCLQTLLAGTGYPMLATHDPRLIAIIQAQAILAGRPADSFEYQMLYGIRPAEQRRLANRGSKVRVYVPYGSDWYGYLTRRLVERPANLTFFLRSLVSRR
jgi:proline dehydrogenase